MAYTWYYSNVYGIPAPVGSRATAQVYPGAVCPTAAEFGRVHGVSPARGTVSFKGAFMARPAEPVTVQIGQSVFYGMAIKGEVQQSAKDGNHTTFSLVDMRDRLSDLNHYAQYNMVDGSGTWWHIYPNDWKAQRQTFVYDIQDINAFRASQNIADDINTLTGADGLLSAMTLLNHFARIGNFTISFTDGADQKLTTSYPENLDFNSGVKIGECIQQIIQRYGIRFTAWGDLHLHFTQMGIADGELERAISAGEVNLCQWRGYVDASLGSELNENGRRIEITGGRMRWETWYPAFADWNLTWDWGMLCDADFKLNAILRGANLTRLSKLGDLPVAFQDDRLHNGKPRNEMTIADYIDNICFKVYRVDFTQMLAEDTAAAGPIQDAGDNFTSGGGPFDWDAWHAAALLKKDWEVDNAWPISQNLCTDSNLQFYVKAPSRRLNQKGIRNADMMLNAPVSYILDGSSLGIREYISMEDQGTNPHHGRKQYDVTVSFSERAYLGSMVNEVVDGRDVEVPLVTPAKVFVRLADDNELFTYVEGDNQNTPRVRTIAKSFTDLRENFVDGVEVSLISRNHTDAGVVTTVKASEIAPEIAARELNHEYLTTAGHITFRTNAGFMPSGIIESIKVSFSARTGVNEVINFTNIRNDDRVPNFFEKERKTTVVGDEELARLKDVKQAIDDIRALKAGPAPGIVQVDDANLAPDPLRLMNSYGNSGNAVAVAADNDNMPNLAPGDILILREPNA